MPGTLRCAQPVPGLGGLRMSPAFLFDLDGTLVDSVYQHVLAWREALEAAGIELAVWRIHRRIGMSGGLLVNALLRETGRQGTSTAIPSIQLPPHRSLWTPRKTGAHPSWRTGTFILLDRGRRSLGHCNERAY